MFNFKALSIYFVLLSIFALPTMAQTPDEETPANEGVCDTLIGATPGLYGLCVGFCEAQDCDASISTTGEVTFDESCKASSPKLLENYNKRVKPGDPAMPCVSAVENGCPCWTEAEIDNVADGTTTSCGVNPVGSNVPYTGVIVGTDATTGGPESALQHSQGFCIYQSDDGSGREFRFQFSSSDGCRASIESECESRGF